MIDTLVLYRHGRRASSVAVFRGDSYPLCFEARDQVTGLPVDITGYRFLMTVSSVLDPSGITARLFDITGVVQAGSLVCFTPSATQTDQPPATYYYDIQVVDDAGNAKTPVKSRFEINQDIGKSVASATEYATTFDNDDLAAGVLHVPHDLGTEDPLVTVWDSNGDQVAVAVVSAVDESCDLNIGGPITGTWLVSVRNPTWRYTRTFDDSNLVSGVLTVTHPLGTAYPSVAVYDGNGDEVSVPVRSLGPSQFRLDFGGHITGTFHLRAV